MSFPIKLLLLTAHLLSSFFFSFFCHLNSKKQEQFSHFIILNLHVFFFFLSFISFSSPYLRSIVETLSLFLSINFLTNLLNFFTSKPSLKIGVQYSWKLEAKVRVWSFIQILECKYSKLVFFEFLSRMLSLILLVFKTRKEFKSVILFP